MDQKRKVFNAGSLGLCVVLHYISTNRRESNGC